MSAFTNALVQRVQQLEMAERLSSQAILNAQFQQLAFLTDYSVKQSPYFAERLKKAGLTASQIATPEGFKRLPLLSRRDLQEAGNSLYCREIPKNHGECYKTKTSGSTGEPVTIQKTGLNQLNWFATSLQDHLWHKRDFTERLCSIRPQIKNYTRQESWGPPAHFLLKTGSALGLPITTDIVQLADWLHEFKPHNLIIYPSTLHELTKYILKSGKKWTELKHIRTIGETLSLERREAVSAAFHVKIEDLYSSQEVGTIALQCPLSGFYHVCSEHLIVEVLHDDGRPCKPTETGRVVVTDLHNFATPLIRYAIKDYAEVAGTCPCGRSGLTLKKIWGRERNLVVMPDGTRHWPLTGFKMFQDIAPIQQYQLIQESTDTLEVRLVASRQVTTSEEAALSLVIQKAIGHSFQLRFTYFDTAIPRQANGKFEEFVCLVP